MAALKERDDLLKGDQQGNRRVETAGERQKEAAREEQGTHDDLGLSDEERASQLDELERSFAAPATGGEAPPARELGSGSLRDRLGNFAGRARSFGMRNRRKLIAGGAGAGIIASIVALIIALLPLKMEAMVKNVMGEAFGPVEHAMQRRAEKVFIASALKSVGSNAPDVVVVSGSPLDIFYTKALRGYHTDLEARGIKIEKGSCRGCLKLTTPTASSPGNIDSSGKLQAYLDQGNLNNRQARLFVRQVTKDTTKWHQVYKRRQLRKWMHNAYGIRRWRVYNQSTGENAQKNFDETARSYATGEYKNRMGCYVGYIFGGTADCLKDRPGENVSDGRGTAPVDGDSQAAINETNKQIDEATKNGASSSNIGNVLTKALSQKAVVAAVPIVGWVTTASRIDDFLYNDKAGRLIQAKNKVVFAGTFAFWAVAADNFKDGKISGDEVNVTMTKLNGIEKSCAFHRIFLDKEGGECLPEGAQAKAATISAYYKSTLAPFHPFFAAWLGTVGKVADAFGSVAGWIIGEFRLQSLEEFVGKIFSKLFVLMLAPPCTGNEADAQLMNCVDAGATVTAFDFAQSIGGQAVTLGQLEEQRLAYAQDIAAEDEGKSLIARMTTTERPSLVTRLAMATPSSPEAAASQAGTYVASAVANPISLLSKASLGIIPRTGADHIRKETHGYQPYAFTEAMLAKPLQSPRRDVAGPIGPDGKPTPPDGKIDEHDCLAGNVDDPGVCKLDSTTIQAMTSVYTKEDDGGVGDLIPAGGGSGTSGSGDGSATNPGLPDSLCGTPAPGSVPGATEPAANYARVSVQGKTLNVRTKTMLETAEGYASKMGVPVPFRISQGSYNAGGVSASAGTHDGGGVVDISIRHLSTTQRLNGLKALRMAGFAAWERFPDEGFPPHFHAVAIGDREASASAKRQVTSYFSGKNGLAGGGADTGAKIGRPYPDWAAKYCKGGQ